LPVTGLSPDRAKRENRKSINFDFDTHRLITVFGEKGKRQAYVRIQRFLEHNGFEHKQWSGYLSQSTMSYLETYALIDRLMMACPWLSDCTNSFDVTDFMSES
jgi:virulence-associated protein VapD